MRERDELVKVVQCVQRPKGFWDYEFCEVFSCYCGHLRVL